MLVLTLSELLLEVSELLLEVKAPTWIQGCLRACSAVILLFWSRFSMALISSFAEPVTESHSGLGYWECECACVCVVRVA